MTFNIVSVSLINGAWVEEVVGDAPTLKEGKELADRLNGSRDDSDELAMVSYVVKPAK